MTNAAMTDTAIDELPISKVCIAPGCGRTFYRPKGMSQRRWRDKPTCGRECAGRLQRKAQTLKDVCRGVDRETGEPKRHPMTGDNVYETGGRRRCRECMNSRRRVTPRPKQQLKSDATRTSPNPVSSRDGKGQAKSTKATSERPATSSEDVLRFERTAGREYECDHGCGEPIEPGMRYIRTTMPPWTENNQSHEWLSHSTHGATRDDCPLSRDDCPLSRDDCPVGEEAS